MLQFPEVQAAAQGEVDNVTRGARLPDFADRERMPYVTALVWECLRWLPVLPMGAFSTNTWSAGLRCDLQVCRMLSQTTTSTVVCIYPQGRLC
jgi:hypothetical protein